MFHSGRKLLNLEDSVKVWTGHDYPPQDRAGPSPYMHVREHRQHKLAVYVRMRGERDAAMAEPKLLHPALQVNIRAGRLPEKGDSGYRLLHLPLKWEGVI